MNDLFRAIFGKVENDENRKRMDGRPPEDHTRNFRRNGGDDDDDDDFDNKDMTRSDPRGVIFGFPLFNGPNQIHKHFVRLVDEMNKAFGTFGFRSEPSITWESESSDMPPFSSKGPVQEQESLRDLYLKKPDCMCNKNYQGNEFSSTSTSNVNFRSDYEQGMSVNVNLDGQNSYPKTYSIFIQTIHRPDGTVETVKKVRDHTGNEKTTITQSNVNDPVPPPQSDHLQSKDDASGISIFKKFFSF